MIPCPYYIKDGWMSDSTKPINYQVADLFDHLWQSHHPEAQSLLSNLASRMRELPPVPTIPTLTTISGTINNVVATLTLNGARVLKEVEELGFKIDELTRAVEKRNG